MAASGRLRVLVWTEVLNFTLLILSNLPYLVHLAPAGPVWTDGQDPLNTRTIGSKEALMFVVVWI